jgi:hypothetical protein
MRKWIFANTFAKIGKTKVFLINPIKVCLALLPILAVLNLY